MTHTGEIARRDERGAILITVLMLIVVFATLSISLLSTAEMSIRVQSNARDLERAERAAQSGVEWAAALVKQNGMVDVLRTTTLTTGTVVQAQVRASTAPQLLGRATAHGVEVTYAADATFAPGPYPHAFLSFSGANTLGHDLSVTGDAYFDGRPPLTFKAGAQLQMSGDLHLATSTSLGANKVVHQSGSTSYSVSPLSVPLWDTTRFTLPIGWTVPVTSYSGNTTIRRTTLTGIVIVNLLGGQKLIIEESTINGTIVVPSLYPPLLDILGTPAIDLKGPVTINGGTANTGNLALLAPTCAVDADPAPGSTISGVVFIRAVEKWKNLSFRGQLMLREHIADTKGSVDIQRPSSFVPTVPYGLVWTGGQTLRTSWRGKQ